MTGPGPRCVCSRCADDRSGRIAGSNGVLALWQWPGRESDDAVRAGSRRHFRRGREAPDRALSIAKFNRMVIARTQAVPQDERCNHERIQVASDLSALVVRGEVTVAATGADDHCRRTHVHRPRQVHRQRRNIALLGTERSRRRAVPQRNDLASLIQERCGACALSTVVPGEWRPSCYELDRITLP